ncbi:MAG: WG repeat-containing protein, partial [Bacteroidia bacterium]
ARQFKKAYEILSEIPIDTKDSQLVRVQLAQAVAQMLLAEKEMSLTNYHASLKKCLNIAKVKPKYFSFLQRKLNINTLDLAKTIDRIDAKFLSLEEVPDSLVEVLETSCLVQDKVYSAYCNLKKRYQEIGESDSLSGGYVSFKRNNLWGYLNAQKQEVIPEKYQKAGVFKNGLAIVTFLSQKKALPTDYIINTSGIKVYDPIGIMNEDMLSVCKNKRWGYLNKFYKEIVTPKYQEAGAFMNGMAIVKAGNKYGFVNKNGVEVIKPQYEEAKPFDLTGKAEVTLGGKTIFIDKEGKILSLVATGGRDAIVKMATIGEDEMQPRAIGGRVRFKEKNYTGFKDDKGKTIVRAIYEEAWDYVEDKAAIRKGGKWGFIDKNGVEVIPAQYDQILQAFQNGRAKVRQNGKDFWIDGKGNCIEGCNKSNPNQPIQTIPKTDLMPQIDVPVQTKIDQNLIQKPNVAVEGDWEFSKSDGKWFAFNRKQNYTFPQAFDDRPQVSDGLIRVKANGRAFFLDKRGNPLTKQNFDEVGFFVDGYAPVKVGKKWGYIDRQGNVVINPEYDEPGTRKGDYLLLRKGDKIYNLQLKAQTKIDSRQQNEPNQTNQSNYLDNTPNQYTPNQSTEQVAKPAEIGNKPVIDKVKKKVAKLKK